MTGDPASDAVADRVAAVAAGVLFTREWSVALLEPFALPRAGATSSLP
jgi:hypothetical protein